MKKHNLFKILFLALGAIAIISWLIPSGAIGETIEITGRKPVGVWSIFQYLVEVFQYFSHIAIFLLVVGGFYGIVNRTGSYKKLLDDITKSFKGKEKIFLIIIMVLLGLLSSFAVSNLIIVLIFPLIITLLLLMGYDKLTVLAATVGSVLVGIIGATYSSSIIGPISYSLGLEYTAEMISKVFLFIISLFLLIVYVLNNKDSKKKKYHSFLEKKFDDPLYINKKGSNKKPLGLIIVFSVILIMMIFGAINWTQAFGVDWFEKSYQAIMSFEVLDTEIFRNIFGNIPPFGYWDIPEFSALLLVASLVIVLIYKIKLDDAIEAFIEGTKRLLPIALIIVFVYLALMIGSYHPFYITISNWLLNLTSKFNVITFITTGSIGSALMVELQYAAQNIAAITKVIFTDSALYPAVGVLIQAIYGLVMFVTPTSALLLVGLLYLDIPYKVWVSYIYKLLLQLLIIIVILSTILIVYI